MRRPGNGDRSGSPPVAAITAGVKDEPGLEILLVRDSIQAVPEDIFVIRHRVEAVGLSCTESPAPRTAPRAAAPAPTFAPGRSYGLHGLSRSSAT